MTYVILKKLLLNQQRYSQKEIECLARFIIAGDLKITKEKRIELTMQGHGTLEDLKFEHDLELKRKNFKGLKVTNKNIKVKYTKKLNL